MQTSEANPLIEKFGESEYLDYLDPESTTPNLLNNSIQHCEELVAVVAEHHGLTVDILRSKNKNMRINNAKAQANYLLRRKTQLSYYEISWLTDDETHSDECRASLVKNRITRFKKRYLGKIDSLGYRESFLTNQ